MAEPSRIAVVPVRDGMLPAGGAEAVAVAGGRALVVGSGARAAVDALGAVAGRTRWWDTPGFAPGAWAAAIAPLLVDEEMVVLPASPDGRDLAPRLAALLERPVLAGAVEVREGRISTSCFGGAVLAEHHPRDPVVVTLQPGMGPAHLHGAHGSGAATAAATAEELVLDAPANPEAEVLEVLPPDVATMDLAEAPRILGGGAGLDAAERFEELGEVAAALDAAMGATRVITDRGWVGHERQIGTTGVVVDPRLYLAFGISGAVQHTAGLGDPDHIISVNVEPHCPMMTMADLAVVADANATLDELAALLALGADEEPTEERTGA
ncbi:MAG: mycofactocin-associated electron transfer flavoprotein alpha subunit [Microthrixaceae bacterium]